MLEIDSNILYTVPVTFRHAFAAPPGRIIVSADYNAQEVLTVAAQSKDEKILETIYGPTKKKATGPDGKEIEYANPWADFHTVTALTCCYPEYLSQFEEWDIITKAKAPLPGKGYSARDKSKITNFAIIYLATARALAEQNQQKVETCEQWLKRHRQTYSTLHEWIDSEGQIIVDRGFAVDMVGRIRWCQEDRSTGEGGSPKRSGINFKIQGCLPKSALVWEQKDNQVQGTFVSNLIPGKSRPFNRRIADIGSTSFMPVVFKDATRNNLGRVTLTGNRKALFSYSGKKFIYRLVTHAGKGHEGTLRASPTHPFLIPDFNKKKMVFTCAKDIKAGDLLAAQPTTKVKPLQRLDSTCYIGGLVYASYYPIGKTWFTLSDTSVSKKRITEVLNQIEIDGRTEERRLPFTCPFCTRQHMLNKQNYGKQNVEHTCLDCNSKFQVSSNTKESFTYCHYLEGNRVNYYIPSRSFQDRFRKLGKKSTFHLPSRIKCSASWLLGVLEVAGRYVPTEEGTYKNPTDYIYLPCSEVIAQQIAALAYGYGLTTDIIPIDKKTIGELDPNPKIKNPTSLIFFDAKQVQQLFSKFLPGTIGDYFQLAKTFIRPKPPAKWVQQIAADYILNGGNINDLGAEAVEEFNKSYPISVFYKALKENKLPIVKLYSSYKWYEVLKCEQAQKSNKTVYETFDFHLEGYKDKTYLIGPGVVTHNSCASMTKLAKALLHVLVKEADRPQEEKDQVHNLMAVHDELVCEVPGEVFLEESSADPEKRIINPIYLPDETGRFWGSIVKEAMEWSEDLILNGYLSPDNLRHWLKNQSILTSNKGDLFYSLYDWAAALPRPDIKPEQYKEGLYKGKASIKYAPFWHH